ncbi:4-hydroxybenzoate 3-monooxygenase [Paracoccus denitrificans]|jgi:p-hydroxybenzoate 3-monooxygenase|uniref:4-hydroxybenzoate 3-monooxygenase n=1 Tax=Paracoccus denitrificans (strain Pd 1222) TaxID=318586 RepID=A1B7R6_PARDP|nr:4-hydroxybenzoate 3-monooxygenase [Paracoccus denitrificans]ABL71560.1 4-hydroxybenzoate 3-monooxygenase [Paracoccus denitrificans PD1222]MBB4628726.1 p-hydroxybenzoate 3-monooxygenase [Paracoccus denitrificans]MCU7429865.1 4-hydroxybenzoate 3-monooxygenase [Paracoccus denitrificans]QAR28159.1 4-hydroxybenzoate 3-monooxygenase [Paracoccus denitrificans]UPV97892.1 4-hydroxybenzoate 3-monooxygenase [Paracoccus denitrificans]
MRTQVVIIGGGPSGLLLGQLLHRKGIEAVVLERKTRDYVLGRIRAGVLETGLVRLMEEAGVSDRLHREGFVHDGTQIAWDGGMFHIDFKQLTGTPVVVYGQTEVTRDLYDAREAAGAQTIFEVEDVVIHDADSDRPHVTYTRAGQGRRIDCDFVAGCDGFHGISRQTIPLDVRREYEKTYPFGWLGILSETPPVHEELIYTSSDRGFALCSMRNANLSRYYIQCALSDHTSDWTDAAFWDELRRRLPEDVADRLVTGPSIEKSIAPLRSFVTEPMRWGRLFLCGDAAHIVPPTGAKGLNTAASDVQYLYNGLVQYYRDKDSEGIDRYSEKALLRVWKAERFSWWFSGLLHRYPHQSPFDLKMQKADIAFLRDNESQQRAFAENYVGLPY